MTTFRFNNQSNKESEISRSLFRSPTMTKRPKLKPRVKKFYERKLKAYENRKKREKED